MSDTALPTRGASRRALGIATGPFPGKRSHKSDRTARQATGQFWTPDWVADAMAGYVLAPRTVVPPRVLEPAVGAGSLLRALGRVSTKLGRQTPVVDGTELFPSALDEARASGTPEDLLRSVVLQDFLADADEPVSMRFDAIIANPPYLRHHHIDQATKARLKVLCRRAMGCTIDARAGLHVYFLIRCLELLADHGRLAFIVPADICEGVFAPKLWNWISRSFRIDAVVTFASEATPFPGVDTNAVILCISKEKPQATLPWARCETDAPEPLFSFMYQLGSGSTHMSPEVGSLTVRERPLSEAIKTGLSRAPLKADGEGESPGLVLGDIARVVRGIVTGANHFFHLTRAQADAIGLPEKYRRTAIGRTRDAKGERISDADIDALDAVGRPTILVDIRERDRAAVPPAVEAYLRIGEEQGLPERAVLKARNPWYSSEHREPPPILFAYLGRRAVRFLRNEAKVVPLTSFLCVYPREGVGVEQLWHVVSSEATLANLRLVGKSYGGGAIKVEPRALERLPIPTSVAQEAGLDEAANGTPRPDKDLKVSTNSRHEPRFKAPGQSQGEQLCLAWAS